VRKAVAKGGHPEDAGPGNDPIAARKDDRGNGGQRRGRDLPLGQGTDEAEMAMPVSIVMPGVMPGVIARRRRCRQ